VVLASSLLLLLSPVSKVGLRKASSGRLSSSDSRMAAAASCLASFLVEACAMQMTGVRL
jgi:hypothetical protein